MNASPRPFAPETVHSALRRRNWQLVGPESPTEWEAFLDSVAAMLPAGDSQLRTPAEHLDRAVTGAYCVVLYAACAADGTFQQHRAYTEVWNWVHRFVARRVKNLDDATDIVQEVLVFISQNLETIARPSGFLAWVGGVAFNRIRRYYSKQLPRHLNLVDDALAEDEEDEPNPEILIDGIYAMSRIALAETEAEILELIDECIPRRARLEKSVFIELGLRQKSVSEVAKSLEITPLQVYTAWHRARRRLMNCPRLIAYLRQQVGESPTLLPEGDGSDFAPVPKLNLLFLSPTGQPS